MGEMLQAHVLLSFEAAFVCSCGKSAFCPLQGKNDLSGFYSVTHRCQSCDCLWKVDVAFQPAEDQKRAAQLMLVSLPNSEQNKLLRDLGEVKVTKLQEQGRN
jgi:hypothetical protein